MMMGDISCIIDGLVNGDALGQALSIGACVKNRLRDAEIIHLLRERCDSKLVALGIAISDLALAATHILEGSPYTGDDGTVRWLVDCEFDFIV